MATRANQSATYACHENSRLIDTVTFQDGATVLAGTTKEFDYLNRLTSTVTTRNNGTVLDAYHYTYNDANQRVRVNSADGSRWVDLTSNGLNQYSQRDVPAYIEVVGSANANATVTVNGGATTRQGAYFRKELTVANSAADVYQSVTVAATNGAAGVASSPGIRFVAENREAFDYDLDGNQIQDGRWVYGWDAENRLISMETVDADPPAGTVKRMVFAYDHRSRRISKTVYLWDGMAMSAGPTPRFVYDGWLLVGEVDASDTVARSYVWGTDLSGTSQGAGGIGGLLAVKSGGGTHFASYDGNGNLTRLINASDGTISATYEYDPFGQVIRATGPMAAENPFRFSTKYTDVESGLVDYTFRFYDPGAGRWLSRDPMGERGGFNLFSLLGNNPLDSYDFLGLADADAVINRQHHDEDFQFLIPPPPSVPAPDWEDVASNQPELVFPVYNVYFGPFCGSPEELESYYFFVPPHLWGTRAGAAFQEMAVGQIVEGVAFGVAGEAVGAIGGTVIRSLGRPAAASTKAGCCSSGRIRNAPKPKAAETGPATVQNHRLTEVQNHHLISNPIVDALEEVGISRKTAIALRNNPALQKPSAPGCHIGYETWHRTYDKHMAKWIRAQGPNLRITDLFDEINRYYSLGEPARRIPGVVIPSPL